MSTFALLDAECKIINRLVIENGSDWSPPEGCSLLEETDTPLEIGGTLVDSVYTPPFRESPAQLPLQLVLSQDLMAQFSTADLTAIKAAVDANIAFWGLWSAMQAQSEPMRVTNARFLKGWAALTQVLGTPRMAEIAKALGVTI